MFGRNPIRPPEKGDGSTLQVVEVFPTLQGEGPYAGHPAVFVRLGGCNLACDFCDTEFENFAPRACTVLLDEISTLRVGDLVVITGGEPLRQPIVPFCEALLAAGYRVQIETNGTLFRPLPQGVDVVCSPKPANGSYHPLREDVLARVSALKFLVSAHQPLYADAPDVGQAGRGIPVYVQPMDEYDGEKNAANTSHALALCLKKGYRLSLQWHKQLGLR